MTATNDLLRIAEGLATADDWAVILNVWLEECGKRVIPNDPDELDKECIRYRALRVIRERCTHSD